jgi:hypothetical protein
MITDLATNFSSEYAAPSNWASPRFFNRLGAHGARGMNHGDAQSAYSPAARPEIGSLWNPAWIDQLKAPLTRYHE